MAAGQGGDLMPFVALGLVKSKATGSGCQERLATPATAVVAASWRSPPRSPRMLSVSGEIGKARMDGFGRPPGLLFAEGGRLGGLNPDNARWHGLLVAGFCGGFTTFSTFSWQTVDAFQRGQPWSAAANVLISVAACLVATWLGWRVAR